MSCCVCTILLLYNYTHDCINDYFIDFYNNDTCNYGFRQLFVFVALPFLTIPLIVVY